MKISNNPAVHRMPMIMQRWAHGASSSSSSYSHDASHGTAAVERTMIKCLVERCYDCPSADEGQIVDSLSTEEATGNNDWLSIAYISMADCWLPIHRRRRIKTRAETWYMRCPGVFEWSAMPFYLEHEQEHNNQKARIHELTIESNLDFDEAFIKDYSAVSQGCLSCGSAQNNGRRWKTNEFIQKNKITSHCKHLSQSNVYWAIGV